MAITRYCSVLVDCQDETDVLGSSPPANEQAREAVAEVSCKERGKQRGGGTAFITCRRSTPAKMLTSSRMMRIRRRREPSRGLDPERAALSRSVSNTSPRSFMPRRFES